MGAGLAGHLHTVDGGLPASALDHDPLHDLDFRLRRLRVDGLLQLHGQRGEAALAVGVVDAVHQIGLHDGALVGNGAAHQAHLHHCSLGPGRALVLAHRLAASGPSGLPLGHLGGIGHERHS